MRSPGGSGATAWLEVRSLTLPFVTSQRADCQNCVSAVWNLLLQKKGRCKVTETALGKKSLERKIKG